LAKTGVHHPFLLPHYHGDGRRYHLNFSRIGFSCEYAEQVSFIELLHVPTTGRSKLTPADLDHGHLQYLDKIIREDDAKHIFVSAGVLKLLQTTAQFRWLKQVRRTPSVLPVIYQSAGKTIYLHLHFSNYGKFQEQMNQEALAIKRLLTPKPNS
jgi:hypothetical protein